MEEVMPSVTRDRKKYGAPSIYSDKARQEARKALAEDNQRFYRDRDPRFAGDNGYHVGRVKPLIEDEQ